MKWKWTLPYIFSGAALMIGPGLTTAQNDGDAALIPTNNTHRVSYVRTLRYDISVENKINKIYLDTKADSLRDIYVSNMLRAQEKLHPLMGRSGYRAAVRRELPGAPVGMHCVWGQYTHLSRALDEMGDTITIIPDGARTACVGFKYHMDKKYNTPDFPDCIHNGVMHETDSAYNAALDKYLARNRVNADTPDSVRAEHVQKFASRNFSADGLDAGAILIVPRYRGSRSKFHAVMYLGRGRLDDGKFIPDSTGRHIYVGHNRENLGDIFKTYDVSNVFAADTRKIARAEYAAELKRIESMPSDELIEFISDEKTPAVMLATYPHTTLVRMARDRYFGRFDMDNYMPIITDATPSVSMSRVEMAKNLAIDLKLNQKTM